MPEAGSTFRITISAVDKASAVVNKVERTVDRLGAKRPPGALERGRVGWVDAAAIQRINSVALTLGKANRAAAAAASSGGGPAALDRRLASLGRDGRALEGIEKGLSEVKSVAGGMAEHLATLAPPLAGLGLGGGAGAAIVAMTARWANLGAQLSRTSAATGIQTDRLQEFRGAARLANADAERIEGSLGALGQTIYQARYGLDPQAMAVFRKAGITLTDPNGRMKTGDQVWDRLADFVARQDPRVRAAIGGALHVDEDAVRMLSLGGAKNRELRGEARNSGIASPAAIEQAAEFERSVGRLTNNVDGLAAAIGEGLLPKTNELVGWINRWLEDNRTGIKDRVVTPIVAGGTLAAGVASDAIQTARAHFGMAQEVVGLISPAVADFRRWFNETDKRVNDMMEDVFRRGGDAAGGRADMPDETMPRGRAIHNPGFLVRPGSLVTPPVAPTPLVGPGADGNPTRDRSTDPAFAGMPSEGATAKVEVTFRNTPPGTRVETSPPRDGAPDVSPRVEYRLPIEGRP